MTPKVSVLGLGIMGAGMARQLISKGFDVTVWNRSSAGTSSFAGTRARIAATVAEAGRDADIVIAMLANDEASRSVWLGPGGALAAMHAQAIAIESSTLSVDWVLELAASAQAHALGFLDAPVTGSKAQAESGTLAFLVGGEAKVLERARFALQAMSGNIAHLGPTGNGAIMKLINNFLCGVQIASLAEALAMAERSGLDARQAVTLLSTGAPGSPLVKALAQRMIERAYEPHFLVSLMAKDLSYARQAFAGVGIDLASADAARERFVAADRSGFGERDIASIVELLRR
jgi:3-hydroxyisobutyrate dehydrogenase